MTHVQLALIAQRTPHLADGETLCRAKDGLRLATQYARVYTLMADGRYRTLREIADTVNCSEASVSARLRDMRKPRHGGHYVERRRRKGTNAVWEYRLLLAVAR